MVPPKCSVVQPIKRKFIKDIFTGQFQASQSGWESFLPHIGDFEVVTSQLALMMTEAFGQNIGKVFLISN